MSLPALLVTAGIAVACDRVPLARAERFDDHADCLRHGPASQWLDGHRCAGHRTIRYSATTWDDRELYDDCRIDSAVGAETDVSGRVTVKFLVGTGSGSATITAISGGASVAATSALKILVGTAAVGRVIVSANPTLVPSLGGATTIAAVILDINGNPLARRQ